MRKLLLMVLRSGSCFAVALLCLVFFSSDSDAAHTVKLKVKSFLRQPPTNEHPGSWVADGTYQCQLDLSTGPITGEEVCAETCWRPPPRPLGC